MDGNVPVVAGGAAWAIVGRSSVTVRSANRRVVKARVMAAFLEGRLTVGGMGVLCKRAVAMAP